MVDDNDKPAADPGAGHAGFELPLRLLAGFRVLITALHDELERQGHAGVRPMYGFALQAIGAGCTATEFAAQLSISKQAAGKLLDRLERLDYIERERDADDSRRINISVSTHGRDLLRRSAVIFEELRQEWIDELGRDNVESMERDLATMTGPLRLSVDLPGWFSA